MRSMLAEIQARLPGTPHEDEHTVLGRPSQPATWWACERPEASIGWSVVCSPSCAPCLIAAHAAAGRGPGAKGVSYAYRDEHIQRLNDLIITAGLPLPLVPETVDS